MPNPNPVKPLKKAANAYEKDMRTAYLNPLMARMDNNLAQVTAASQAFSAMDHTVAQMAALPQQGVPVALIQQHLDGMQGYQRAKVLSTFRSALGVNVNIFLLEPPVRQFMLEKVADNVSLIKTIPKRLHESLRNDLTEALRTAPFDRQMLTNVVGKNYKSSGYNLRRVVRDQSNKTIGGLNQIRQQQLGISEYIWMSSKDNRVRPEHQQNDGNVFAWSTPPLLGPPGQAVQCRCYSRPIISPRTKARLTEGGKVAPSASVVPVAPLAPAVVPGPPNGATVRALMKRRQKELVGDAPEQVARLKAEREIIGKQYDKADKAYWKLDPYTEQSVKKAHRAQIEALGDEYNAFNAEIRKLTPRIKEASAKLREEFMFIKGDIGTPMNYKLSMPKSWSAAKKAPIERRVAEAVEEFQRMMPNWADDAAQLHIQVNAKVKRAYFLDTPSGPTLTVGINDDFYVYMHELAHAGDASSKVWSQTAVDYLNRRAGKDKLSSMGKGYYKGEVAKPDEFTHKYMGKIYSTNKETSYTVPNPFPDVADKYIRATEINSMGLHHMYLDPIKLATDDADLFDHIWNVVMRH